MTPVIFFLLTFFATWSSWLAAAALTGGAAAAPMVGLGIPLFYLGVFSPALVALLLTWRTHGSAGVSALLERILIWRVRARWYVFAVAYLVGVKLTAALVHRVAYGAWPPFGTEPWYLIAAAIPLATLPQAGEEIGWRGYALPRLAAGIGLGPGSIVLGVMWASWHLPLFYLFPAADTFGQPFPAYLVAVTAVSVAMGWLYGNTGGSLLLVMLMHSAVNQTTGVVRAVLPEPGNVFSLDAPVFLWLTAALLWLGAACFLARMPVLRIEDARGAPDPAHRQNPSDDPVHAPGSADDRALHHRGADRPRGP